MATDSWKDRLTSYNGQTITYDSIGNPLTYNNGSAYTFTWEGRQMQTATKDLKTWTYTYNSDGLRTGKSNGSAVYTYTWNENRQLQSMTWNYGYAIFSYDANGMPYSVKNYDAILDVERTYLYITSLQGDVLSIIDASSGATAVTYTYDAWGRELSWATLNSGYAGLLYGNPLTYRGYIYDRETGFYYLQSRYYDPTIGRFLNADDTAFLGISGALREWNLFAYCENNTTSSKDIDGFFPVHIVAGVALGIVWSVLPRIIGDIIRGRMSKISDYICDVICGAVAGLVTSLTGNSTLGSFLGTFLGETARFLINNGPQLKLWSFKTIFKEFVPVLLKSGFAMVSSIFSGKIIGKLSGNNFSSKQIKNYFNNTKYLKSAFGIGSGGKTGRRMWFADNGITTVFYQLLNALFGLED